MSKAVVPIHGSDHCAGGPDPIPCLAGGDPVIMVTGYDTLNGGSSLIADDTWTRVADGVNRTWTPGNGFMSNGDSTFNWVADLANGTFHRNESAHYWAFGSVLFDVTPGDTIGVAIAIESNLELYANYLTIPAGATDSPYFSRVTTTLHWWGNPFSEEVPFELYCYQLTGGTKELGRPRMSIFRGELLADMELVE